MSKPTKSKVKKTTALAPKQEGAALATVGQGRVTEGLRDLAQALSANLTTPQLAQVFDAICETESAVEHLKGNAKERLLSAVRSGGTQKTEAGSMELMSGEWTLEARVRDTGFDDRAVERMLRSKGFDPSTGMDATVTYKTNEVKLASCGLTEEEIQSCRKQRTFVLQRPRRSPPPRPGGADES